jgi:hypothetical protein
MYSNFPCFSFSVCKPKNCSCLETYTNISNRKSLEMPQTAGQEEKRKMDPSKGLSKNRVYPSLSKSHDEVQADQRLSSSFRPEPKPRTASCPSADFLLQNRQPKTSTETSGVVFQPQPSTSGVRPQPSTSGPSTSGIRPQPSTSGNVVSTQPKPDPHLPAASTKTPATLQNSNSNQSFNDAEFFDANSMHSNQHDLDSPSTDSDETDSNADVDSGNVDSDSLEADSESVVNDPVTLDAFTEYDMFSRYKLQLFIV